MRKVFFPFLLLMLPLIACNLTRTPPTPTERPPQPTQATSIAPTLFASITPLPGGSIATLPAPIDSSCPPPAGWVQYTIEGGDSLGALAQETGATLQQLIDANCLSNPDTLFAGQVIYLPTSPVSG